MAGPPQRDHHRVPATRCTVAGSGLRAILDQGLSAFANLSSGDWVRMSAHPLG